VPEGEKKGDQTSEKVLAFQTALIPPLSVFQCIVLEFTMMIPFIDFSCPVRLHRDSISLYGSLYVTFVKAHGSAGNRLWFEDSGACHS
jgi:hypothetical protein